MRNTMLLPVAVLLLASCTNADDGWGEVNAIAVPASWKPLYEDSFVDSGWDRPHNRWNRSWEADSDEQRTLQVLEQSVTQAGWQKTKFDYWAKNGYWLKFYATSHKIDCPTYDKPCAHAGVDMVDEKPYMG